MWHKVHVGGVLVAAAASSRLVKQSNAQPSCPWPASRHVATTPRATWCLTSSCCLRLCGRWVSCWFFSCAKPQNLPAIKAHQSQWCPTLLALVKLLNGVHSQLNLLARFAGQGISCASTARRRQRPRLNPVCRDDKASKVNDAHKRRHNQNTPSTVEPPRCLCAVVQKAVTSSTVVSELCCVLTAGGTLRTTRTAPG